MDDGFHKIPEGAEESFVVREAIKARNLVRAQEIHAENRRLREALESAGIDPEEPIDPFAKRSAA